MSRDTTGLSRQELLGRTARQFTRISGCEGMFNRAGLNMNDDSLAASKKERFVLCKREETLALPTCQLEALSHRFDACAILFFEYLGGSVGGDNGTPRVFSEELGILRNRAERQITLPCPSCQVCQEASTLGMLDETPRFVDVQFTRAVAGEHLCPDKVSDEPDPERSEFLARHIANVENNEMAIQLDIGWRVKRTSETPEDVSIESFGQTELIFAAHPALQDFV